MLVLAVFFVFHPRLTNCPSPGASRWLAGPISALLPSGPPPSPGVVGGATTGQEEAADTVWGGRRPRSFPPGAVPLRARPGRCRPLGRPSPRARALRGLVPRRRSPGRVPPPHHRALGWEAASGTREPLDTGPGEPCGGGGGLHRCATQLGPGRRGGRWPRFPSGGGAAGGGPQPGLQGKRPPLPPPAR